MLIYGYEFYGKKESIHSPYFMHNFLIKMPRIYYLREDGRAMGAAQIIIALIHCALWFLCFHLFIQEEKISVTGYVPVPVILIYTFWTVPFFINSGSTTVQAQRHPTRRLFVGAIMMNIISFCVAAIGTAILTVACLSYQSKTNDYVWSYMAGSMLLQFLLFSTISEMIIAGLLIHWIMKALQHTECDEESFSLSECQISITS
ncbi:membrane-spanning 4-domains subfamily A member 18-like [Pipistrellus kuhlii]|uniref:membrane-spanning 4-domains subfamily A member 18-like n=1 Tax=Pipistrellus kuhlii TaxID=59472 RepID=UPI00174EDC64|nr:membrane-spanning 4-domains subfamily A member 18-like [Pipistrellus kuhlii]